MRLIDYPDSELMWIDIANRIAGALNTRLTHEDRATLVVPGGTTPGPLFDVLSAVDLHWNRIDVLLSDERWVPDDHPRSNARLLRERLLVDKAQAARFLPYFAGGAAPDVDLTDIASAVARCQPFAVTLLGMGADMHTASLFPGADNLPRALAPGAPALVAIEAPGAEEPRVTLSAEAINGTLNKHLVIVGDEKRAALERAAEIGDPMQAPVAAVLDGLTVHWART